VSRAQHASDALHAALRTLKADQSNVASAIDCAIGVIDEYARREDSKRPDAEALSSLRHHVQGRIDYYHKVGFGDRIDLDFTTIGALDELERVRRALADELAHTRSISSLGEPTTIADYQREQRALVIGVVTWQQEAERLLAARDRAIAVIEDGSGSLEWTLARVREVLKS